MYNFYFNLKPFIVHCSSLYLKQVFIFILFWRSDILFHSMDSGSLADSRVFFLLFLLVWIILLSSYSTFLIRYTCTFYMGHIKKVLLLQKLQRVWTNRQLLIMIARAPKTVKLFKYILLIIFEFYMVDIWLTLY